MNVAYANTSAPTSKDGVPHDLSLYLGSDLAGEVHPHSMGQVKAMQKPYVRGGP